MKHLIRCGNDPRKRCSILKWGAGADTNYKLKSCYHQIDQCFSPWAKIEKFESTQETIITADETWKLLQTRNKIFKWLSVKWYGTAGVCNVGSKTIRAILLIKHVVNCGNKSVSARFTASRSAKLRRSLLRKSFFQLAFSLHTLFPKRRPEPFKLIVSFVVKNTPPPVLSFPIFRRLTFRNHV